MPNLPFKPLSTLKIFYSNGYKYSKNSMLNVSKDYFPPSPSIGKSCAFICNLYVVKGYVQALRAYEVESTNRIECFTIDRICHKKPLKLLNLNGSFYVFLHPLHFR